MLFLFIIKIEKDTNLPITQKTNKGYCCTGDSLEYIEHYLSTSSYSVDFNDIYSYIQFAEQINKYIPGTLYFEGMPTQPYEYW